MIISVISFRSVCSGQQTWNVLHKRAMWLGREKKQNRFEAGMIDDSNVADIKKHDITE